MNPPPKLMLTTMIAVRVNWCSFGNFPVIFVTYKIYLMSSTSVVHVDCISRKVCVSLQIHTRYDN